MFVCHVANVTLFSKVDLLRNARRSELNIREKLKLRTRMTHARECDLLRG